MTLSRSAGPGSTRPEPGQGPADALLAGPPRRLVTKKRVTAAAVAAVLVGGGAAAYLATSGKSSSPSSPVTITYQDAAVSAGTMKETVSASGTLTPADDSTLTFAVPGTVTAVDVTTGQQVAAGQTLATIDSTALQDQVNAAQSTLTADEDRLTADQAAGAASSTISSDEAQVATAGQSLTTAETNLSDATLKATFSGTVAAVDLTVGQTVGASGGSSGSGGAGTGSSGASGSPGSVSASTGSSSANGITVISADTYILSTSVDDTEVSEVQAGDQVTILPSGSSTTLYGTVASVSLIASSSNSSSSVNSSSGVASFPVTVDVTGTPSGVYPGDSATADIIVKEIQDAVEVPTAAISYSNGQPTVTEVVGRAHKTVAITTGITANGYTQVTAGLSAGDTVVERVVKFNAGATNRRTLFGGTPGSGRPRVGNFPAGGGFPGGGGFGGAGGNG